MNHRHLIVMAGGSGTRLWPLSRKNFPKQFLKIGSPHSLVRETFLRLVPWLPWKNSWCVCGKAHARPIAEQVPEIPRFQILPEPCARNTAAAIAWSALTLLRQDSQAVMVVLPADHKILEKDLLLFQKTLEAACQFVENGGGLVTLGIRPRFPATGYGYIQQGEKISEKGTVYQVKQFREKPNLPMAQKYIKDGGYWWNSGMFIGKATDFWKAYQQFLPQDAELLQEVPPEIGTPQWNSAVEEIYPRLTSISVDYAILEKSSEVYVIPCEFYWDDVGSLDSLAQYFPQDQNQNAVSGTAITVDASQNLILCDAGIIACLGINDLIVIRQGDAVLVLPKSRSEEVKKILSEIEKAGWKDYL